MKPKLDIGEMPDEELTALRDAINAELAQRNQKRRDEALKKIQDIAGAAGLDVSIRQKPGRKPKKA